MADVQTHTHTHTHTNYSILHTVPMYSTEYNVSKEKQRLQNLMAYGSDLEPARQLPGVQPNKEEEEEEEKDRFDEGNIIGKLVS